MGTDNEEVKPQNRPQLRPQLKLTTGEVYELMRVAEVDRSTVQRWAGGRASMRETTERRLRRAMGRLGIPFRVVRPADAPRESVTLRRAETAPIDEPMPQSA